MNHLDNLEGLFQLVPGHDVSLYVKDNLPKIMLVAWFSASQLILRHGQQLTLELEANSFKWLSVNYRSILISVASNLIYIYIILYIYKINLYL